ncbi:hypothetical protein KGF54_004005 [Candida jiufengensis]|uniref:uncharacterized protein n=1 Tax=Candida jiufengensis TaxID=497108 RepID=UPI0022253421|nr:uncharacterized protein KGF54_004005 [Candida jiufengensis]KAI5950931.1 hypothetical protein KGF54_004005 [Candida jiufengensis]
MTIKTRIISYLDYMDLFNKLCEKRVDRVDDSFFDPRTDDYTRARCDTLFMFYQYYLRNSNAPKPSDIKTKEDKERLRGYHAANLCIARTNKAKKLQQQQEEQQLQQHQQGRFRVNPYDDDSDDEATLFDA